MQSDSPNRLLTSSLELRGVLSRYDEQRMAETSTSDHRERPCLYDLFDDEGRVWLDAIVQVFNEGGYTEARNAFLADEVAAHGSADV